MITMAVLRDLGWASFLQTQHFVMALLHGTSGLLVGPVWGLHV